LAGMRDTSSDVSPTPRVPTSTCMTGRGVVGSERTRSAEKRAVVAFFLSHMICHGFGVGVQGDVARADMAWGIILFMVARSPSVRENSDMPHVVGVRCASR